MNLKSLFRGAQDIRPENVSVADVPELAAVRFCIANVVQAREALAIIEAEKEAATAELNERMEKHGTAQSRLADRIKQLAQDNELPDRPIAEMEEVNRFALHVSIRRERVSACEARRKEAAAALDARIREVEEAWAVLGKAISENLLEDYRAAVLALRDAHSKYLALGDHFSKKWNSSLWPFFNRKLAILDPKSTKDGERVLLIDPRFVHLPERWPNCAREVLASIDDLRSEIETAKRGTN
ncbi:MAG: hypothetical protein P4L56_13240 [Candidatus Sulfopaludibacter sp.]|nr:hypothetical protein [Candidatus Sulfopaludibacter sp.]